MKNVLKVKQFRIQYIAGEAWQNCMWPCASPHEMSSFPNGSGDAWGYEQGARMHCFPKRTATANKN